jgi:hypothetical protein
MGCVYELCSLQSVLGGERQGCSGVLVTQSHCNLVQVSFGGPTRDANPLRLFTISGVRRSAACPCCQMTDQQAYHAERQILHEETPDSSGVRSFPGPCKCHLVTLAWALRGRYHSTVPCCRVNTLLDVVAGVLYISAEVLNAGQQSTVVLSVPRDAQGELSFERQHAAGQQFGSVTLRELATSKQQPAVERLRQT